MVKKLRTRVLAEKHISTEIQCTVYYGAGGAFRIIGGSNAGLYYRLCVYDDVKSPENLRRGSEHVRLRAYLYPPL